MAASSGEDNRRSSDGGAENVFICTVAITVIEKEIQRKISRQGQVGQVHELCDTHINAKKKLSITMTKLTT